MAENSFGARAGNTIVNANRIGDVYRIFITYIDQGSGNGIATSLKTGYKVLLDHFETQDIYDHV